MTSCRRNLSHGTIQRVCRLRGAAEIRMCPETVSNRLKLACYKRLQQATLSYNCNNTFLPRSQTCVLCDKCSGQLKLLDHY